MRTAMQNLHERWGLSNSEIARALDISQRVVRLARDGSEPAEGADRLDEFLSEVHRLGVEEPAAWMSEPIVQGYTATRWHMYTAGRTALLTDNAAGRLADAAMLDAFDSDWRRTYWTSMETFVAEDGNLSIREKSYDTVRAQMGTA